MDKTINCGRLIKRECGTIQKIPLSKGGGVRGYTWNIFDANYDEIHQYLRKQFLINPKQKSLLYDFKFTEFDKNQYQSLHEYVTTNGLKYRGTLLYLFTSEVDNDDYIVSKFPKKRQRNVTSQIIHKSISSRNSVSRVKRESSTLPPILIEIDNEPQHDQEQINDKHSTDNSQISLSTSFEKSLNELINRLRNLVNQNNRENIFTQIFESVCQIRGKSSTFLKRLKQKPLSLQEYQREIDDIEQLAQSVKTLIDLNQTKISENNRYSIIIVSFNRFDQNFKNLRDHLMHHIGSHRTSSSSSATHHSIAPVPLTSSSSSSYRVSTDNDKSLSFDEILKSFNHMLEELYSRNWISFYNFIQCIIAQIRAYQINMKNDDYQSLCDAENLTVSIRNQLINRMHDEYNRVASCQMNQRLEHIYQGTLNEIKSLLKFLDHCKLQLNQAKRTETSNWSTPPRPYSQQELLKHKPRINLKRQCRDY